jgi:hypothetical protein
VTVAITRQEGIFGRSESVFGTPDPRLAGLVLRYGGFSERFAGRVRRRIPAFDHVPVILSFGLRCWIG